MDFYEEASLVMVPSGYKDQKVYSSVPDDNSGDLTFSRASNATRVGPDGLIEKVRTNVLLQSNSFDTTWVNSNSTETSGQAGYDGTSNAWLLNKTGANGQVNQSVSSSGINTFSAYAKAGTSNFLRLTPFDDSFFDLANGIAYASGPTTISANIVSVGNGWYRCSITYNATSTIVRIIVADSSSSSSGTSGNILIQSAQVETGDIATDYIATTSAAVSVGPVANLPRLDYLDSSSPRLLLEPQRTNLVQYSESFNTSSSWSLSRTSAFGSGSVVNAVTSPDGYTNAEYIQQATGETDGGGCFQGISYTSGTTYTLSVFAKQGENRYARIGFGIGSGGAGIFCGFDLQDGIAGTPDTGLTAKIENYGNGWYRCSIKATAQITGARNTFVYQSSNLNTFVTTPLQGIYVYGAQLEASASYATSYVNTLGAAVTRGADSCKKTGISSLIGQTEGTLFVEAKVTLNGRLLLIADSPYSSNLIEILTTSAGKVNAFVYNGSVQADIFSTATYATGDRLKIALAYKQNDFVLYVNGTSQGTDTSANVPTGMAQVIFNDFVSAGYNSANAYSQALLFPTRLSNADLATLTTL
jgi:hypothetical protein